MKKTISQFLVLLLCLYPVTFTQAEQASMNFQNVDIRSVIAAVSKSTGKNFIIDPRVTGKVTLVSSSDVDPDVLYDIFLSILKVHGYVAIPDANGQVIKIVPEHETRVEAKLTTEESDVADNEVTLRVIDVKHAVATEMIPILRPLVSKNGHLAAHPSSNIIIVSDTQRNVDKISDLIKQMDGTKESNIRTVELRHANAIDAANAIKSVMQKPGKTNQVQIVGEERTNSVIINGTDSEIAKAEALLDNLDIASPSQRGSAVIKLNFAEAKNIADILNKMISAGTVGGSAGSTATTATTNSGNAATPQALPDGTINLAAAAVNATSSGKFGSEKIPVQISVDEKANSIIIIGSPRSVENLRRLVRQLDVRRTQIMVETLIVEMSADKTKQLGIQWGGATDGLSTPSLTASLGSLIGTIKAGGTLNFAVLADALATDADANLISAPSVLTLENEEAEISVGREVPFITGSFTTGTDAQNPFTTIERSNVGLTLKITPQINKGEIIKLKIDQEFSNILPNAQSTIGAADVVTSKRTIKTNVLVKNEQMLVLGGLIDDNVQETENRVPGVSRVPLIGRLFKSKSTTKEKRNLMIFIQPRILRSHQRGETLTANRYNQIRNLQQQRQQQRGVSLLRGEKQPVLDNVYNQPEPVKPIRPKKKKSSNAADSTNSQLLDESANEQLFEDEL